MYKAKRRRATKKKTHLVCNVDPSFSPIFRHETCRQSQFSPRERAVRMNCIRVVCCFFQMSDEKQGSERNLMRTILVRLDHHLLVLLAVYIYALALSSCFCLSFLPTSRAEVVLTYYSTLCFFTRLMYFDRIKCTFSLLRSASGDLKTEVSIFISCDLPTRL